jgi:ribonuclease P protein component
MLTKNRRIPRENFSYILSNGARFNSPRLLLYIAKIPEKTPSRVAFSVSKKVCPKAVDRNRYRRIGYSAISVVIKALKPSYFLFFSYKKGSIPAKFEEIEKEVKALLSSSSMLE